MDKKHDDPAFLKTEANRCLQCPVPLCAKGCPAGNNPREFIRHFREGSISEALTGLHKTSYYSLICGHVCDAAKQCEGHCVLNSTGKPIPVQAIERFLGTKEESKGKPEESRGKKAAVIGSGPAGYNAAVRLALRGFSVTVYEKEEVFGGLPYLGIPSFRLPKKHLDAQVKKAGELGIKFEKGSLFTDFSPTELKQGFDAVLIATGYGSARRLAIEGESKKGILYWDDVLRDFNLGRKPKVKGRVLVIGGGNTAIDSAMAARKFSEEVTVVYRRSEAEMPASQAEMKEAKDAGISFKFLLSPAAFLGGNSLDKVRFEGMELGSEKEGRRSVSGTGTFTETEAETAIIAAGQRFVPEPFEKAGIETDGRRIAVNGNYETSLEGVFAAGDAVSMPKTVADAVRQGIAAAEAIAERR
jgi:NADPH-dependent glutamate synthase beta subunit-like oxidoreductase